MPKCSCSPCKAHSLHKTPVTKHPTGVRTLLAPSMTPSPNVQLLWRMRPAIELPEMFRPDQFCLLRHLTALDRHFHFPLVMKARVKYRSRLWRFVLYFGWRWPAALVWPRGFLQVSDLAFDAQRPGDQDAHDEDDHRRADGNANPRAIAKMRGSRVRGLYSGLGFGRVGGRSR